jgi:type I restriction enzyme S subunit
MNMNRYEEYKDYGFDWIGEVPKHWTSKSFRYCIEVLTDFTANGSFASLAENVTYQDHGYSRLVRLTDLRENLLNEGIYVSEEAHRYLKKSELFGGELLIANVGAYAGLVTIMPKLDGKMTLGPNMFLVKTTAGCDERFFYYLLSSPCCSEQLKMMAVSSAQPKLNKENIRQLKVVIPPIDEQLQIIAFLDEHTQKVDTLISKKEKLIELLQQERTTIINQAVTKGLDPNVPMKASGVEWLGEIPKHWELKRIKHLTSKIGSGVTPKGGAEIYQTTGIALLRSQNVHFDGFKLEDVAYISEAIHKNMSGSKVYPNDVLLNITGGSIGRCFYVTNEFLEANVNQHVCILRPNSNIETKYLYNLLRSDAGQIQIDLCQAGGNRESLNFEQVGNFFIPYPGTEERSEILAFIQHKNEDIVRIIEKTVREIELIKEYKTTLISEVVIGKIDVRKEALVAS